MDQRAKKLEKRRKARDLAKRRTRAVAARKPSEQDLFVRSAAGGAFGPCAVSKGWDAAGMPALVTAVVTRKLPDGRLLPGISLVDRTCLGVKSGFVARPVFSRELDAFLAHVGRGHGGMLPCEPLVVQSVVFHAIDFARGLGFEPDRDFPATLFGPRPTELLSTPWHAPEKPWYMSGPRDNVRAIMARLAAVAGAGNFDYMCELGELPYPEDGDDENEDWVLDDEDDGRVFSLDRRRTAP